MRNIFFLLLATLVSLSLLQSCLQVPGGVSRREAKQVFSERAEEPDREIKSEAYFHYAAAQVKRNKGPRTFSSLYQQGAHGGGGQAVPRGDCPRA